jgi:hypothetical protein
VLAERSAYKAIKLAAKTERKKAVGKAALVRTRAPMF